MSFTMAASEAILKMLPDAAETTYTTSGALLEQVSDWAEGIVCTMTRKDWITDWANVQTPIQNALGAAVSAVAANIIYNKNMDNAQKLLAAQTNLDFFSNLNGLITKQLEDDDNQVLNK